MLSLVTRALRYSLDQCPGFSPLERLKLRRIVEKMEAYL